LLLLVNCLIAKELGSVHPVAQNDAVCSEYILILHIHEGYIKIHAQVRTMCLNWQGLPERKAARCCKFLERNLMVRTKPKLAMQGLRCCQGLKERRPSTLASKNYMLYMFSRLKDLRGTTVVESPKSCHQQSW